MNKRDRTERCERRDRLRGQIRTLSAFYKNCQTWEVASVGAWLVAGILLSVQMPLLWVPYQEYSSDERILCGTVALYLLWLGIYMYLRPYTCIAEGRKSLSMPAKLKFHPVDRRSLRCFFARRLLVLLCPIGAAQLAGQCVAAFLICGRVDLCNVLYPLLAGLLIPGGLAWLTAVTAHMRD